MQCYQHNEQSAIGICKICNKGLCHDCATDTEAGLACDQHIEKIKDVELVIDRNIKTIKDAPVNTFIAPAFFLIMGIGFIVAGLTAHKISPFTIFMGVGFSLFSAVTFIRYRKIFKNK